MAEEDIKSRMEEILLSFENILGGEPELSVADLIAIRKEAIEELKVSIKNVKKPVMVKEKNSIAKNTRVQPQNIKTLNRTEETPVVVEAEDIPENDYDILRAIPDEWN